MALKPLPSSRTRDASAEHGAMGARAVNSTKGVESPVQGDATGARQNNQGAPHRPREERELDEQRRALASLILGVFEADTHPGGAAPASAQVPARDSAAVPARAAPAPPEAVAAPSAAASDPRLEKAIVEFMYALFQALDEIDDTEPTLAHRAAPPGHGAASARSGFGERIDLLASRLAAAANPPQRLERAHAGVLQAIHPGAAASAGAGNSPIALAALLRRLANAMHVAPSLGYGASANAGALLRVRA